MEMLSLSRTTIVIKSNDRLVLDDCRVLINGAGGYWYDPGGVMFKTGETRTFILSRFFSVAKRQFNYSVDSVSSVSVNCSKPRGAVTVFEKNESFGGFLN